MKTRARPTPAVLALAIIPLTAWANPCSIDGASLGAFIAVALWAFVIEAGTVALLLTISGAATLPLFAGYFCTNAAVFFFVFKPLLERHQFPLILLELLVVLLDGAAIKMLLMFDIFQGDNFAGVTWRRSLTISGVANTLSYFVGYIASKAPWIMHGNGQRGFR